MIADPVVADTVWLAGAMDSDRTVKVMVAVADPAPDPVAVIVTGDAAWTAVGVPVTTPVADARVRPAGSVPDDGLTSAERRERAALRRVGLWGVVLGTASVLLLSAWLGSLPWA